MQNKNKLISVKEAAEIFINNEFPELDTSCPEYKTALKNAEYKIYKAKDKHNLNVFGSKQILLDRKEIEDFVNGEIARKNIYYSFGNISLDFDESVRFLESFHNQNGIKNPLKYNSMMQYGITNKGQVIDLTYRKTLSQSQASHEYLQVRIRINGKDFDERVHVLVAFVWCANEKLKCEVHHIDGNIFNNNAVNLIWVTKAEHLKAHELLRKAKETNDFTEYNHFIEGIQKNNEWNEEYRCVAFEKETATIFVWITKKAYNDYKNGIRTLDEIYFDEVKAERIVRKCQTEKQI